MPKCNASAFRKRTPSRKRVYKHSQLCMRSIKKSKVITNTFKTQAKRSLYAPSLPNSAVHSAFRCKSSLLTVGRALLMAFVKSFNVSGGSSNWSDCKSDQVISRAPLSPGEHGVNFSPPSTGTYRQISIVNIGSYASP